MSSNQPATPGGDAFQTWNSNEKTPNPQANPQQVGPRFELSEEERKVLRECERESFYLRALPYAAGAIVGVQVLSRMGKLALHPKYGTIPKSIFAGGLGYFIGKVSYLPICRKKILLQIPDSRLAKEVKKNTEGTKPEPSHSVEDSVGILPAKSKEDELDDRFRPSVDREVKQKEEVEEKKSITYEELRRRNRQEHAESHTKQPPNQPGNRSSYKDSPHMPQKPWPDSKSESGTQDEDLPPPPPPSERPKRKRTNMWGDVIDD